MRVGSFVCGLAGDLGAGKAVCYVYEGSTPNVVGSDLFAAIWARPAWGLNLEAAIRVKFPCRTRVIDAARLPFRLSIPDEGPHAEIIATRPLA